MSNKKDFNRICRKFPYCKASFPPVQTPAEHHMTNHRLFLSRGTVSPSDYSSAFGVNVFSTLARHGLHKKRVSLTCLSRFKEPQIAQYGRVFASNDDFFVIHHASRKRNFFAIMPIKLGSDLFGNNNSPQRYQFSE